MDIDALAFMKACFENEKQALAIMKSLNPNLDPIWVQGKEQKIAWMAQEIANLEGD